MRLQLALGLGAHRKVAQGGGGGMPDWDMTFTSAPSTYRIGWKDMPPVGGNLQDLIDDGFVSGELEGVTAHIVAGYVSFTGITAGKAIRIKKTADITHLYLSDNSIKWTYNGALPAGLTYLNLYGNSINWTWDGALPAGLTYMYLFVNANWTWNGALPARLTYLSLLGEFIKWTYNGALPTGLTHLYLNGGSINWTGSEIGNIDMLPNITNVNLSNFISPTGATMTVAQFSGIINSLAYNVGTLPVTVTINELPYMTSEDVDWGEMNWDLYLFVPSDLAVALKTVVKTKEVIINLTAAGLTMPTETDDGDGFPEGFGDWWRIEE